MSRPSALRSAAAPAIILLGAIPDPAPAAERTAAEALYLERALAYTGGPYREHPFPYRLLLPEGLGREGTAAPEGKRWPLVLFLHGAGERGSDNRAQLKFLPADLASPESRAKFPCFLLAPQCPAERWWSSIRMDRLEADFGPEPAHETRAALLILEKVLDEFPVDRSRIYLTGISMGGYGSWDIAARCPGKWAAVVPVCGGGSTANAPRIKDLPIWVFHGAKDPVVPVARSREMVDALRAAGGAPRYTEFPDAGHDSWTPGYRHPEFLPWLFAQKRAMRRV